MNKNYPTEKQVCTLEQAKKLAKLLGDDAPESLWVWAPDIDNVNWRLWSRKNVWMSPYRDHRAVPAYTGDELGALLKKVRNLPNYPINLTAQDKANIAIQGLEEGWIKKEEFKYE